MTAQNNNGSKEDSAFFVKGISNSKIYTKEEADKGNEYELENGKIVFYFDQLGVAFYFKTETSKTLILTEFTVGKESDGEISWEKDNIIYQIGLHDFNDDNLYELVIAVKDKDEYFSGVELNIFKYIPFDKKWEIIGTTKRKDISGEPIALVDKDRIKIERNFRGFYSEWILSDGKFKIIHED